MITGNAEVRWELRQRQHGETAWSTADEYPDESEAQAAFGEACSDTSVSRAELVMLVEVTACTHSKSSRT